MPKENKNTQSIVSYFVQLRLKKRDSQTKVANKTGISLTTYQRIEQGKRDPKLSELEQLCHYYNVTWLDVAHGELSTRTTSDSDLIAALKNAPVHIRQPIIELIKAVSS
ncbi:helix-turn-helix domain-containing protein [Vibrio chagasii]|uniref:helix-turn-helix domain-containing protein n=1 Tax=Vibrio chagasii TaxID=170679 RepID=UPI003DA10E3D